MEYIILDMEWNQPFSVKSMIKKPVQLYGEIIQIGAVKVDAEFRILDTFKIMVAPKYYRQMNKKVSKLTGIRTEDLEYGFSFRTAFGHFQRWCGQEFVFLTWGDDDADILRNNMILHRLEEAWIPDTYNVQLIFAAQILEKNRQLSLEKAMVMVGEDAFEAHDALHDAINTVRVCRHLDMDKGLAEYAQMQAGARCQGQCAGSDSAAITYRTKEEALQTVDVLRVSCPVCGREAVCSDVVRQNADKFIAATVCEGSHELFVRYKFAKRADGRFRVTRLLYEMNEESRDYFLQKKRQVEEKREKYLLRMAAEEELGGTIDLGELPNETGAESEADWIDMEEELELEEFDLDEK